MKSFLINGNPSLWVLGLGKGIHGRSYAALIMYLQFISQFSVILECTTFVNKESESFQIMKESQLSNTTSGTITAPAQQTELPLKPDWMCACSLNGRFKLQGG